MIPKTVLTVCLMASCIWCLALVTRADNAQPESTNGSFKPVAPVASLMHGQQTFFKEIAEELQKPPSLGRDHEIEEAAEVLAELANVNRHNKDKDDYRTWATQLRDTALVLAAEAKKKKNADEERMKSLFQKLKDTCSACHDVYQ